MDSYYSLSFWVVFIPLTALLYQLFPRRLRPLVLLGASYFFFWSISGKLIVYVLFSAYSIHHFGLWLTNLQTECNQLTFDLPKDKRKAIRSEYSKRKKRVLGAGVFLHIGMLFVLKYSAFFLGDLNSLFDFLKLSVNVPIPHFILPIGISFYTMQAVAYMIDVYRGVVVADRNLLRLSLYLTFFSGIIEGPICRYQETAEQLWSGRPITYHSLTFGLQRVLFGVFKKVVIADRLNLLIKTVFDNYSFYDGEIIIVAVIAYTIQLYMEFSGTMDVAIGVAEIFNIKMPENFARPFLALNIAEFWQRWHITLGAWFKDYIFYPLSMAGPIKKINIRFRKYFGYYYGPLLGGSVALLAVWLANGLWHGVGWRYIFFGLYHFALIFCGNLIKPLSLKLTDKLHINRQNLPFRLLQITKVAILVGFGELFFRARSLKTGLKMAYKMFTATSANAFFNNGIYKLGMDRRDFYIIAAALLIVAIIHLMQEKKIDVRKFIAQRPLLIRWSLYYALIMFIVIFGAYGQGYLPIDPMYANF